MERKVNNSVLEALSDRTKWEEFLAYKTERRHLDSEEQKVLEEYIKSEKYVSACEEIKAGKFPGEYAEEIYQ